MAWRRQQQPPQQQQLNESVARGTSDLLDELIRTRSTPSAMGVAAVLKEAERFRATDSATEVAAVFSAVAALGLVCLDVLPSASRQIVDVLDVLSSGLHQHLALRQLDDAVGFLLRSLGATTGGEAAAFRSLGRLVFVNADRSSRWHDTIGAACVAILVNRRHAVASLDVDALHTALVCLGNLLSKAGASCKPQYASVVEPVLAVVTAATVIAVDDASAADRIGRLLSSGLRVLHVVFQSDDPVTKELISRNGDAVLRMLHYSMTFAVALERTRASHRTTRPRVAAHPGPAAANSPLRTLLEERGSSSSSSGGGSHVDDASSPHNSNGLRSLPALGVIHDSSETDPLPGTHSTPIPSSPSRAKTVRSSAELDASFSHSPSRFTHAGDAPASAPYTGSSSSSWYTDSGSEGSDDDDDEGDSEDEFIPAAVAAPSRRLSSANRRPSTASLHHPRRIPIRVRVTAHHCLHALANASPRVVQSRWGTFVPEVQGTHPRPFRASLLTVLLYDPSTRVREAAAAALCAVVMGVPLDKWIAAPAGEATTATAMAAGHTVRGAAPSASAAAAAASHAVSARTPAYANASDAATAAAAAAAAAVVARGSAGAVANGQSPHPPPSRPSLGGANKSKAAFSSLSDKTTAIVRELHAGLERSLQQQVLQQTQTNGHGQGSFSRKPGLVSSTLRAAAVLVGTAPYDRLPTDLPAGLCYRVIEAARLAALPSLPHTHPAHLQVLTAALHFCGAVLPRLVGQAAAAVRPFVSSSTTTVAAAAAAAAEVQSGTGSVEGGASSLSSAGLRAHAHQQRPPPHSAAAAAAPAPPPLSPHEQITLAIVDCLAFLAGVSVGVIVLQTAGSTQGNTSSSATTMTSAATATTLRPELLTVLNKAARTAPSFTAGKWRVSALCPFLVSSVTDDSPLVRSGALRLLEELLRGRAAAVTHVGTSTLMNTAPSSNEPPGTAAPGTTSTSAQGGAEDDDAGFDDGPPMDEDDAAAAAGPDEILLHGSGSGGGGVSPSPRPLRASHWRAEVGAGAEEGAEEEWTPDNGYRGSMLVWSEMTWGPQAGAAHQQQQQQQQLATVSTAGAWPSIPVHALTRGYVVPALRDNTAAVRSASAACLSYLLPQDWMAMMSSAADGDPDISACVAVRNEVLLSLIEAAIDPAASVRASSCRIWGAYAPFPNWHTPAFLRLAASLMLALVGDDSLAVRAKASWALGNIVCDVDDGAGGLQSSGSSSFGFAVDGGDALGDTQPLRHGVVVVSPLFPMRGEAAPPTLESLLGSRNSGKTCSSLLERKTSLQRQSIEANRLCSIDGGGGGGSVDEAAARTLATQGVWLHGGAVVSPLELYHPGRSQSRLVNTITLPLLRQTTLATLVLARSSSERVASTAVRTLGYCARALALHWLPLPAELRHALDPIVLAPVPPQSTAGTTASAATAGGGLAGGGLNDEVAAAAGADVSSTCSRPAVTVSSSTSAGSSKRMTVTAPCPDNALLKAAMLLIADVIAGGDVAMQLPVATAAPAALPSSASAPVGSSVSTAALKGAVGAVGGKAVGAAAGPKSRGPAVFSRPAAAQTSATSASAAKGGAPSKSSTAAASAARAPSATDASKATATAAASVKHSDNDPATTTFSSSRTCSTSLKVRWNACRAVGLVLPLMHRVACTHGDGWTHSASAYRRSGEGILYSSSSSSSAAAVSVSARPRADTGQGQDTADDGFPSNGLNSPPRPRVRRDSQSGIVTPWAGVDHVSTANSPFVTRAPATPSHVAPPQATLVKQQFLQQQQQQQQQHAALSADTALSLPLQSAPSAAPTSASAEPSGRTESLSALDAWTITPDTAAIAAGAAMVPAAAASLATDGGNIPGRRSSLSLVFETSSSAAAAASGVVGGGRSTIVTDATLPSVSIDYSWGPPLLAALQVALTRCDNFKVRIAAAHSIALVPSRPSFRVPVAGVDWTVTNKTLSIAPAQQQQQGAVVSDTTSTSTASLSTPSTSTSGALLAASLSGWSTSHLSPALQLPGYDAFPAALMCLLTALEQKLARSADDDSTELRYSSALLAAVRSALLHQLCLVEKLDYGRMKGFLDEKAEFMLEWLVREVSLHAGATPLLPAAPDGSRGDVTIHDRPSVGHILRELARQDACIRAGSIVWSGLGSLHAEPAIPLQLVQDACESMTGLFSSRVKSIPVPMLQRYRDLAAECSSLSA